ncbi:MAG: gamma-glutamyl-gamma-aminobutyrate hydrolase family protein [Candidatus Nanopelagicales bacterium]|jgi:putative glutamine amidotransferase|nr:gamma-glutamyl-gamma-aminobutyrate hydrolase family protein [Candidatus Nanopelagicales bacterium]
MRPVIGLTAYVEPARWAAWHTDATLLHTWYPEAVTRCGGIPVLLPPQQDAATELVERVDALILTGGPDIAATMYGQEPHSANDRPRHMRDEFEVALYRTARDAGKPVLGICRGLQVMAVAEGGYLTQHLPDVTDLEHKSASEPFADHLARFMPGSLAHRLLGESLQVNSRHHQAVADPGRLVVTGLAEDDTVEACEVEGASFALGVQWHPEHGGDVRLFQALIAAASS